MLLADWDFPIGQEPWAFRSGLPYTSPPQGSGFNVPPSSRAPKAHSLSVSSMPLAMQVDLTERVRKQVLVPGNSFQDVEFILCRPLGPYIGDMIHSLLDIDCHLARNGA